MLVHHHDALSIASVIASATFTGSFRQLDRKAFHSLSNFQISVWFAVLSTEVPIA
jgi:hypothetical protein